MEREKKAEIQALMLRLQDGDRAAFDPLYAALWPVLRRFTERVLSGSADADDAAQLTLLKVFANASALDRERDALTWVLGIAAFECKTLRTKARRRKEDAHGARELPTDATDPEQAAIARDLEAAAREVLGTLEPGDIATLQAVIAGERPTLAAATFRKRVERALRRLREAWSMRHDLD